MADTKSEVVTHFDRARQMFHAMSKDDQMEGCFMAVAVYVSKTGEIVSGISWENERPEPFRMIGALEMMKQRVLEGFVE